MEFRLRRVRAISLIGVGLLFGAAAVSAQPLQVEISRDPIRAIQHLLSPNLSPDTIVAAVVTDDADDDVSNDGSKCPPLEVAQPCGFVASLIHAKSDRDQLNTTWRSCWRIPRGPPSTLRFS